ncbi:hypothetical protein PF010_g26185 [Phytophthora fragariae]|uniref:Uncharacterized protein n=1 Tax=Phytophthora fragariae TaxID=53985 RepID=A0A6G0JYE6_9STRA|nr:hypothetical protein PF010_g26185 [Phytophthora fragariae]
MAGSESIREGGRSAREGTRRSRRTQGAPPEEQLSLEEVERSARRRNAERRKAAREEKESTDAQDQPDLEPAVQDAHQASPDTGTREGVNEAPPEDSERDPNSESQGASIPDAPAQASVGDAVKVEPPAADETSESPPPVQDVVTLEEESSRLTCKEEGPLPAVQEEPTPHVPTEAQELSPESTTSQASRMVIDLTEEVLPEVPARHDEPTVTQVKTYVADQVRRWERVTTEFVASPTIEYSWPSPPPDFQNWWAAVMMTPEYIASRTAMASSDEAWISEWNLVRLAPNIVTDVTAITVPPSTLSPRECAALTQTLFFEMGFRFSNLVPEWFQARASRVDPSLVRTVVEDLQQLLAVEILEWRGVISNVVTRIVPALSLQVLNDEVKSEEGDVTMLEYESELIGRECLLRMKAAGIRKVRSPASSAIDKPEPKRSQFGPPRPSSIPSLSSHLSYPSSVRTIQDVDGLSGPMSVAQSASSRRTPDRESSIFGTTVAGSDESNFSNISGSRSSGRVSSSSSSMWSFRGGAEASNHMRYAGLTGVVMMAQGGVARGGGDVGVQISDTTLTPPLVLVDQDDVMMSESGHVSIRSDRRSKKSHAKPRRQKTSSSESPSDSSSDVETRRRRRSFRREGRSSKHGSKSKRSPSRSVKSEWTRRSGQSGRSTRSGPLEVALSTMRSTQEALSRMELRQEATEARRTQLIQQAVQATQAKAAQPRVKEEVAPRVPSPPVLSERGAAPIPDMPVNVEAIQAEALRRAQEVAQVELDRRWQQQRSEVEAEKAAWAADFQRQLTSQMDIVQQKMREMEEARTLNQATIRALQNVQRTRSRNIPTTSPQVQGTQATSGTDSATLPRTEPVRMAMYTESSGISMGKGDERLDKPISDLTAAQLRATLQPMTETKYAKTETTSKVATTNASRTTAQKSGSKSTEPTRSGSRKLSSRRTSDRKHSSRQAGDPSDDSSSSGSSDSGSSDDDSDSSSGGGPPQATTATTVGGTTLTFRPYVSSSTLEDFDEDAQLSTRRRWWERFLNFTVQGGWSDRTKVYELKLKMPPAVRNWRGQLYKRSRRDWTWLSKLFKREYCKSKLSEAERYYTMTQRKGEKALVFL